MEIIGALAAFGIVVALIYLVITLSHKVNKLEKRVKTLEAGKDLGL